MEPIFLFIYEKDGEIIARNYDDAKSSHDYRLSNGWKHIDTIDAVEWVKHNYLKLKNQKDEK